MSAEIISLAERREATGAHLTPPLGDTLDYKLECSLWSIAVTLGLDGQGPFQDGPPWVRRRRS
jgi:hypothetical protein